MDKFSLRIYVFLCLLMWKVRLLAQDYDDDFLPNRRNGSDDLMDGMNDVMDYQAVRITFTDILLIALLIASCYVFGKIWRGCTYLILAFAALLYYMTR